jgi:site-specific DNA recombinase
MNCAAIYARVSSHHQVQEQTINSQLAKLEEYAQSHNYQISEPRKYIDDGFSGKNLHRPGLHRLRDDAFAGIYETILCYSPDRLSRNLGIQQLLLAEWEQLGISMIFIHRPPQADNPAEMLLRNMEGVFAEYERAIISDRMQRGRRYRLQQGQSAPWPAPYGYIYCPAEHTGGSRWQIHPTQATVVKEIFFWYTEEELKIAAIVRRLNKAKIAAPEGGLWGISTLNRLLHNPAYQGKAYWGRHRGDNRAVGGARRNGRGRLQRPRRMVLPMAEWIEVAVPAIIETSLWQKAQQRKAMNIKYAHRNSHYHYLLHGLLVCGICGQTLYGRKRGAHRYYYCSNPKGQKTPGIAAHRCSLRADALEHQVWVALSDLLSHPQQIKLAWEAEVAAQKQPETQRLRAQQQLKNLRKERKRLLDAYQAGAISLEEFSLRQNPLIQQSKKIENSLNRFSLQKTTSISLETFTKHIEVALKATDDQTKQEMIRLIIDHIEIKEKVIIIHHIIPQTGNVLLEPAFRYSQKSI